MQRRALLLSLSLACFAPGCGDEQCGPGDATGPIVGTAGDAEVRYGELTASANNDCSVAGGPVSLTLEGRQEGTGRLLVLCLPRPDELGGEVALGDPDLAQLVDVFADDGDCLLSLDRSRDPSGTVSFAGVCDDGLDPAGFSIEFSATVPVTRTCPDAEPEAATMTLSGIAPVAAATPR